MKKLVQKFPCDRNNLQEPGDELQHAIDYAFNNCNQL